jgi:hypothetical protein
LGGGAAIGQAAPVNPVVPLTHTVEDEALEIAIRELNAPQAAEKLLELLVAVIIRNAEDKRRGDEEAQ